jgi:cell division septation protein DedD
MRMKNKIKNIIYIILISGLQSVLFINCNSAIYEIVEIEEEIHTKDTNEKNNQASNEITEIKSEIKVTENKFTDKQLISKTYVIQIGAFKDEHNALNYLELAKNKIHNTNVYAKNIDGLIKIRTGNYINKQEALEILQNVIDLGFKDSFIVEISQFINDK